MSSSFQAPQSLATYDITKPAQAKLFVKAVGDLFSFLTTAQGIASILQGSNFINNSAVLQGARNLSGGTQTFDCSGQNSVVLFVNQTAAMTLTLSNLSAGVPVFISILNNTAGALNFKVIGTSPFTVESVMTYFSQPAAAGTAINFTTTFLSIPNGQRLAFSGGTLPDRLHFVGVLT